MRRRFVEIQQEVEVRCDVALDDIVEQLDEEERRELAELLVGVDAARGLEGPRAFSLLIPDAVWRFGLATLNGALDLEGFELVDLRGGGSR